MAIIKCEIHKTDKLINPFAQFSSSIEMYYCIKCDKIDHCKDFLRDQGFVAVSVEDLERWSRRLSLAESYCNRDIVKVNKEMKKYLSEAKT